MGLESRFHYDLGNLNIITVITEQILIWLTFENIHERFQENKIAIKVFTIKNSLGQRDILIYLFKQQQTSTPTNILI